MKALVTTLLVCCCVATSSAQAIECLSSPKSESGWWSWREIDGRKCWYKKVGAVPPKSEFVWPDAKEAPPSGEATPRPSSTPTTEGMRSPLPRIEMARVKPVDLSNPNFRLADGRVGLMEAFSLSSLRGIGGAWEVPHHVGVRLDPFEARYGRW